MRIALGQFWELDERCLRYASQLGASGIVLNSPQLPRYPWQVTDLIALRTACEAHGLRLEAIENVPLHHYRSAILGLADSDERIADYQETITNLGAAGVDILGFHWMANGVARTDFAARGRGGARVSRFDQKLLSPNERVFERAYDEDELWATFEHFIDNVIPTAEAAGVRLALHPDDPPVSAVRGVPHLFRSVDALERAVKLRPSSSLGVDLCLGTVSEMMGDPRDAITRLGELNTIVYVHFRDVQGTVPAFQECFLGEGNFEPAAAMRLLRDINFDGFIIDDHAPLLDSDPATGEGWAYNGHAHATGYLQGLLAATLAA
jgi:mannonate dehydratase